MIAGWWSGATWWKWILNWLVCKKLSSSPSAHNNSCCIVCWAFVNLADFLLGCSLEHCIVLENYFWQFCSSVHTGELMRDEIWQRHLWQGQFRGAVQSSSSSHCDISDGIDEADWCPAEVSLGKPMIPESCRAQQENVIFIYIKHPFIRKYCRIYHKSIQQSRHEFCLSADCNSLAAQFGVDPNSGPSPGSLLWRNTSSAQPGPPHTALCKV